MFQILQIFKYIIYWEIIKTKQIFSGHPNVKLFISHGGLLSYTEAVHFGIPMIIIQIFGDQSHNAEVIEEKGNGLILEFKNITEVSLKWALNEAIGNPR